MSTKPLLIGITGGIGAGKSMVAKSVQVLGVPCYFADDRGKWLLEHDMEVKKQVLECWGDASYRDKTPDRNFLASRVFNNPKETKKMNEIVHPAVKQDFDSWAQKRENYSLLAKESALLFETNIYRVYDVVILVTTPKALRLERILQRDPHRTREAIKRIMDQQWEDERKIPLADYVLVNDGKQLIFPQIERIYRHLLSGLDKKSKYFPQCPN